MNRIAQYYDSQAASEGQDNFLKQVGHTVRGKSISQEQFDFMVAHLCNLLELGPNDRLLDLCCGNGVITHHLAKHVQSVVGVDFSTALINVANKHHQSENTRYYALDALELERLNELESGKFTKVLMHGALQHFQKRDLELLIQKILDVSVERPFVLISYVPEKSKSKLFYDTPRRRFNRIVSRIRGIDAFGTWWTRAFIERTCKKLNRRCCFHQVDQRLEVSRYRFDVTIS